MSRKRREYRREVQVDERYGSRELAKFINKVMFDGKKSVATRLVYESLDKLSAEVSVPQLEAFNAAIKNVMPLMEVKSRRVGGSTYQVPVEVKADRGMALAMRWIISNARSKSGRSFVDCLSSEFIDAFNKTGSSIKKREDTHKMAEANKAFSHFRW